MLDAESGEVRHVLLEGLNVEGPADVAVAVTPDRESVIVVRPRGSGQDSEIVRVRASGGDAQPVTQVPSVVTTGGVLHL